MSIAGLGLGLGLGAYLGGPILALAVLAAATVIGWVVSGHPTFQRGIDGDVRNHKRLKQRLARDQLLEEAGLQRDHVSELCLLVDEVDRTEDGRLTDRLELDALLDQYAQLSVARHRLLRSVRQADRSQLERDLHEARATGSSPRARAADVTTRRVALIERRIAWAEDCTDRAARCGEEMSTIEQFIRLVNQRASSPDLLWFDEAELDRRLLELDEEEAALRHLLDVNPTEDEPSAMAS